MKFYSILLLSMAFLVSSCNEKTQSSIKTIEAKDFYDTIKTIENAQIIDVRTPEEFALEHIDKAINIDWLDDNFVSDAEKLDKSKPLLIYCKSGHRSKKASEKLQELGFTNIYELNGGFEKWKTSGFNKHTTNDIEMSNQKYKALLNSNENILINVSEKSCDPCEKMAPYLIKLQKELRNKLTIIYLDSEENKTLINEFKIEILPSFFLYKNNSLKWKHSGYISEEDLKKELKRYMN